MKSTLLASFLFVVGFFLGALPTHAQVTQIYSDYGGYWTSSSTAINATQPDNSHNLLAFKKNGVVYSTGVDDAKLTANGVSFNAQKYRALPISEVPTGTAPNVFFAGWGWLYDGISRGIPDPAPTFTASQLAVFLTDGVNGLNMGTGLANIPNGTTLTFNLSANGISPSAIGDGIPDIVFMQIASPSTSGDKMKFVNASGATVGTELSFTMNLLAKFPVVGVWKCDFVRVNQSSHLIAETRNLSVMAVDVSELGIDASNYSNAARLVYTGSGEGDPAFIAFNEPSLSIATYLSVTSQPTVYVSGSVFASSITVTVKDGAGAAIPQSGTPVTVALESGSGTLSGTLTRNTDAAGTATFNDLKITGSGDHRLSFSSNGLVSASSAVISNNAIGGTATANQVVGAGSIPEALTLSDYSGTIQWQVSTTGSDGWSPISTATEATLSGAFMGSMTATRYYRAEVTKSSTTAYSNIITIEVGSSTSGSYSSSGIDYTVATITGPGTWTAPAGVVSVDYLLVGGGGGGGMGSSRTGGGGSGGEVKSGTLTVVPGTAYAATIGAGGSAGTGAAPAAAGGNSTFSTISASGGGRGGQSTLSPGTEAYGGGHHHGQNGAAGSVSYRGGNGYDAGVSTGVFSSGGGGGAGGNGGDGNSSKAGDGGAGLSNSWQNGSLQFYGGGGGGAFQRGTGGTPTPTSANRGVGGSGGGGDGGYTLQSLLAGASPSGTSGTQNTGGGGGAAALDGRTDISAGAGGSGLLVIRHRTTTGVEINSPGTALDFDGVDDYVNLPSGVYFDDNTFTVESWVYLKSHQQYGRLCDFSTGSLSNNVMFSVSEINDGKPYFLVFVGGTPSKLKSPQVIPLNRWTHLAYVQDGSIGYMYINGVEVASGTMSTPPNLIRNLCYIGESSGTGAAGDLRLDEFRIWDVARPPSLIAQGMYTEMVTPSSGLAHYYKFSHASGTTLVDQGSDPKHGTLMNFGLTGPTSNWTESYAMVVPQSSSVTDIKTSGFTAQWTLPSVGTVEGLRFEHSADQTFESAVTSIDLSAMATSFAVDGLSAGTTRYWRLRAEKSSVTAQGGFSAVQTTTTLAGATWNGSVSGAWNTAGNWTPSGVPATGSAIVISSGTTSSPELSGSVSLSSLSLASGNSLDVGSRTLTVTGNIANNGTINATSGTVSINGSTAQTISGSGTISNVEVDNASGVTITSGAGNMQNLTGTLTLTSGTLATNGNLTLKSSSSGTARIASHSTAGNISGNVTVERWVDAGPLGGRRLRQWRMLGFPYSTAVTLSAIGGMAIDITPPSLSMMYFSESGADGSTGTGARNAGYQSFTALDQQIATGQGVMAWLYGTSGRAGTGNLEADITIATSGTLQESGNSVSIPLSFTSSRPSPGWNLVANPYASSISWSGITRSSGVETTVYRWNPANEGWTTRNTAGGNSGGADDIIESGAAFFVRATATDQSLTIPQSAKTASATGLPHHNRAPFRLDLPPERMDVTRNRLAGLRVKVSGQGNPLSDDIYIDVSRDDATAGYDRQYDSESMGRTSGAGLSVKDSDGKSYAMQFDAPIKEAGSEKRYYNLGVTSPTVGQTKMEISTEGDWNPQNSVSLIDKKEGKTYLLQSGTLSHSFNMTSLKEEGRFILAINHVAVDKSGGADGKHIRLLGNPVTTEKIDLLLAHPTAKPRRWELSSMQGAKVAEGRFDVTDGNVQYGLDAKGMRAAGVYVLKVELDNGEVQTVQVMRK